MFDFASKNSRKDSAKAAKASRKGNARKRSGSGAAAELAALQQMIDGMPVNVMTLELDNYTIDFVNKTSLETLKPLEHLLPCKVEELAGQCVDIFHANPENQRKILADPKNLPYNTQIKLGDEILDLLVTPIFDQAGNYTKPMLTWSVITEKVKLDTEAERVRQMVDGMPINVMTLELDGFTLDYCNKTSIDTLRPLEHLLPCKADDLLGQCVDIFHANPEHQRKLLADPKNLPYNTQIKLGDEILDLLVTPIYDKDGAYLQPMLTWSVITAKVKADEDTGRLMQMLDDMPLNIMTIDPKDLTINYINKTSVETLRPFQSLLPCKVDDIMGQCIDIFHQNPSHQRNILSDPNNLPHSAKIKLADETLDLKVSAIRDKDGNYIGAMLNWAVITAQVALADNFETNIKGIVESVSSSATEMQGSAQSLSSTAEETSRQSTAVAAASEEASTNVQTVASAAEELSKSVEEVGRQVGQSNKIAEGAVEEAQRTNEKFQGLAEAASKIGEVVNLINDIASQTNLLALNATIEAARAGEAGKGFAVVASEVKSLANQTAKATEEIAAQIGAIQAATTDAVSAIQGIGSTIGEISEIASAISGAVDQQSSATREIATNVQQAASGTQEVSQNISGVTQAASETGEAASQVLGAADELSKQSELLRDQVDSFLVEIRAM